MSKLDLLTIIIWAITGVFALTMEEIPKLTYGMTWLMLMFELVSNHTDIK